MDYKIFLDTNCLLDIILNRQPNINYVLKILSFFKINPSHLCISALSIPNIIYIAKLKDENLTKFKRHLLQYEIIQLSKEVIDDAFSLKMKDFENAIQLISALKSKSDFLVTWNTKDYKEYSDLIKIISPKDLI